nr:MAG TPA: Protein of unknown function (DUF3139) [Caudoviricetes sp.]
MKKIITIIAVIFIIAVTISFVLFPEMFDTVSRASLKRDIENGDKTAIEYYVNRYEKFGINLFD